MGDGVGMNSSNDDVSLDGLPTPEAKQRIADWLEASETGESAVIYKLHDWLFSRQRYWGEPFPIVYGDDGTPSRCRSRCCPSSSPRWPTSSPASSPTTTVAPGAAARACRRLGQRRARSR